MTTILLDQSSFTVPTARADGESLWLPAPDAQQVTGWTLKPEGFCKGEICAPVPPDRAGELAVANSINVAALWRHLGQPLAHDATGDIWVLGTSAAARATQLESLEAPDFSLPDLAGRKQSLNEHRGKKVLLVSWASW